MDVVVQTPSITNHSYIKNKAVNPNDAQSRLFNRKLGIQVTSIRNITCKIVYNQSTCFVKYLFKDSPSDIPKFLATYLYRQFMIFPEK